MSYRGFHHGRRGRGNMGRGSGPRLETRPQQSLPQEGSGRSQHLNRFFYNILEGKLNLLTLADSCRFIEAICRRTDKSDCIERLASSRHGQKALHKAVTTDTSIAFINNWVSKLLEFLSSSELKVTCNGEILSQVLWNVVDPPLFWNALVVHVKANVLDERSLEGFAWLLLQVVILPIQQSAPFRETANSLLTDSFLEKLPSPACKSLFQKAQSLSKQTSTASTSDDFIEQGPGGRHDNDFISYHDISTLPTKAELECSEKPFLRNASGLMTEDKERRAYRHLDNQYRLLREDMVEELRDDLKCIKKVKSKNNKRNLFIKNLELCGVDHDALQKERPCSLVLRCSTDILNMPNENIERRKKALKDTPAFLKHQSFGCIMVNQAPLSFATIIRNENLLALDRPCICLLVTNEESLRQVLHVLLQGTVHFLQVPTPLFAYEPILKRLQNKIDIELEDDILACSDAPKHSPFVPEKIVKALETVKAGTNIKELLCTSKQVRLDKSQIEALKSALTYQVSCIQGPPGTGKSFVGALLTYILLRNTEENILVLAYTNHALDQFLEELMDIGIESDKIVRLGSKSTLRTTPLLLRNQTNDDLRRSRTRYELIKTTRDALYQIAEEVRESSESCLEGSENLEELLLHIEFHNQDRHYYDAFQMPEIEEGHTLVGANGKDAGETALLKRWIHGKSAGPFAFQMPQNNLNGVWNIDRASRETKTKQWREEIQQQKVDKFIKNLTEYNAIQNRLRDLQRQKDGQTLSSKRVVGCTTTAASMYAQEIQSAAPGIIVVEEAGEILESHILAAMGPSTKHLIQIGDHKQLRPKVKSYKLTVESGRGFDLNRSMFERLVLQGRAHSTLLNQHRMRPEISELIRHNYPDLQDAKGTENRPHLRGFQSDVVFVNHSHLEATHGILADKLDENVTSSKQNGFEADMVLKCVRYLGQQGYRTTDIVILTPYLGQLSLLRNRLSKDHDPVLSDFDSHDLVQAGMIPPASANINKTRIRLSTIDNYQGEESDIVLVSLTRSNENGDIGFMRAPERLNVLISRARNALIMIGNAETFMNAKNGREEWVRLFETLKSRARIYDGFPLQCQKHPSTVSIAKNPIDFDMYCPDGGCTLPCAEMLSCGKHTCPKQCHILLDHSKMPCRVTITDLCQQKHIITWDCCDQKPACQECRLIDEQLREKARRNKALETARQAKQFAYTRQLQDLQDQIAQQRQIAKDRQDDANKELALEQQRKELARLAKENTQIPKKAQPPKNKAHDIEPVPIFVETSPQASHEQDNSQDCQGDSEETVENLEEVGGEIESKDVPFQSKPSEAEQEWQYQKDFQNASNEALDSMMSMIGLESVKNEFLSIKTKVDTVVRQGADLKDERFSAALLGNPGTGKTTVARHYAKFLSSVGAIPGDHFEETTGSRLANDGIQGCQTLIDKILEKGGGVFFLDEAYQIVSSSSMGGRQVLDFLLAEIENLTGKVVFVFAGYRKQMEEFFAHNPGIPSRVPVSLDFQDYEDEEILRIFNYHLGKRYQGRMQIEQGPEGRLLRIVARRIGRGRGREGFGNAREVQNVLSRLLRRQAERLRRERRAGQDPDDMLLTKIDLIGPPPSRALHANKDWKALQKMIGLKSVKQSVQVLIDRLQTNYERELQELPQIECSLNKCFLGNPGTGKTTVAKQYGRILKAVGLLSNGEVVIKNPADFVGGALGQSEKNAKAILDNTKGKVLIIDEAYMLAGGGMVDPYKTAVIDTIVAEIQSTANEDRCVLLLGYKEQMEEMFRKVNPGLSRRFPIASGFHFDDYNSEELGEILDLKLTQQCLRAGERAKKVVLEVLERERHKPHFGNAGAVDIVLNEAKDRQQKRLSENPNTRGEDVLIAADIDPDYDRGERAATNIPALFQGVVGCEEIVKQLQDYQQVASNMKASGMDPREVIPFNFLFRGPPGTGKTSTARRMGKVYYDMGFLGDATVVECSATDIVGEYVGQTGPKVQKKFDEALGKVLFIDEAYRLAEGHFAKEAMDEIVDCLTKERFQHKLIVILAGYENDINRLMAQNPGLTRRFPDTISFSNLPPHHCRDLLLQCLKQKKLDTTQLENSPRFDMMVLTRFETLCKTPSWGNAGDIQTLTKNIFSSIMKSKSASTVLQESSVLCAIDSMIKERVARGAAIARSVAPTMPGPLPSMQKEPPANLTPELSFSTRTETSVEQQEDPSSANEQPDSPEKPARGKPSIRDVGVSDEAWAQLELDKAAEEQRHRNLQTARKRASDKEKEVREKEEQLKSKSDADPSRLEALRALEAMRLERNEAAIEQARQEERMREMMEMKIKVKKMGRCPAGYEWIEQADGFRCEGGSHFLSNEALGLED